LISRKPAIGSELKHRGFFSRVLPAAPGMISEADAARH
jgi:hypothetical protein